MFKNKRLYDNKDIQNMLDILNENAEMKEMFEGELQSSDLSTGDKNAITYVLEDGWYETFDRYDSAVVESFIVLFENSYIKSIDGYEMEK